MSASLVLALRTSLPLLLLMMLPLAIQPAVCRVCAVQALSAALAHTRAHWATPLLPICPCMARPNGRLLRWL